MYFLTKRKRNIFKINLSGAKKINIVYENYFYSAKIVLQSVVHLNKFDMLVGTNSRSVAL